MARNTGPPRLRGRPSGPLGLATLRRLDLPPSAARSARRGGRDRCEGSISMIRRGLGEPGVDSGEQLDRVIALALGKGADRQLLGDTPGAPQVLGAAAA